MSIITDEQAIILSQRASFLTKKGFRYSERSEYILCYATNPLNSYEGIKIGIYTGRYMDEADINIHFGEHNTSESVSWLAFFHDDKKGFELHGMELLLYLLDYVEANFNFVTNIHSYADINERIREYNKTLPPRKFNPDTGEYELINVGT